MKYVLGVDGGQTKTLAMIAGVDGEVIGCGLSGPSNHLHEPGAYERLERSIKEAIDKAAPQIAPKEVHAAFFGMTTLDPRVKHIIGELWHGGEFEVENDTVSAWAGATKCNPGVITISGTGSVSFGVNKSSERCWSAYWAYLFGDEGSGYDLGRKALVIAARASDGRGQDTLVLELILNYFRVSTMDEVREIIYGKGIERFEVARLARFIIEAAKSGDRIAERALIDAGSSLAEGAIAVIRKLGMVEESPDIYPIGGVFENAGSFLVEPFKAKIVESVPEAMVKRPLFPPVVGSVFMALSRAGLSLKEKEKAYDAVERSYRKHIDICLQDNLLAKEGCK